MRIVLRTIAVLSILIAAFLVFAVLNAAFSGGAREIVAIGYLLGAALLVWLAVACWRRARRPVAPGAPPPGTPPPGAPPPGP